MRIALQPAFVLHHRPYRETSLLVDLLTQDHGRITVVARGVRTERSKNRALIQPFTPLLVSWQSRTELGTLTAVEANAVPVQLRGDCLLGAFYLNELLMRVLHKHDPHPELYAIYHKTLLELQGQTLEQKTLRIFEKRLLDEIGYGLHLECSIRDRTAFSAEKYYYFYPEQGFQLCEDPEKAQAGTLFSGKCLLALAAEVLEDPALLREAKRIMRMALAPLLGSQPLHSRKLFIEVETS